MGQVYEVERIADAQRFALKVMTGVADRLALARFAREAQIAAELDHPNVVSALDVGVTEEGTLYLVMELVAGVSVAARRARFGDAGWALPILHGTAQALAALHARGIVHRDLKPANILLAGEVPKVTDFGLAAIIAAPEPALDGDTAPAVDPLTHTGAIMGTPMSMAPELAVGASASSAASDVFSFGVLAFELLAGRLPYAASPVTELVNGRQPSPPLSLARQRPELQPALANAVDACMRAEPARRPTAHDLVAVFAPS